MALAEAISLLQRGEAAGARRLLLDEEPPGALAADHAFLLGACAHALGEIPEALQQFTQALKQRPEHAQAACALGALYAGLGKPELAEGLLRQTLGRVEDRQLRFNLAVVLENLSRADEALAEYGRLLGADPADLAARHNRAGLHAQAMRLAEAAADYRELIHHHPGHTLAWQNLADIELAQGRYDAAAQLLTEVLRRQGDNGKALLSLAISLSTAGHFAEADLRFQELQGCDPGLWNEALARVNGHYGQATRIEPELLYLLRQHEHREACDWYDIAQANRVWSQYLAKPGEGELMPLSFRALYAPVTAAAQRRLAEAIAAQAANGVTPYAHQPRLSHGKLRIGYCSSQFSHHATGVLLKDFFRQHDPANTQIYLLALTPFDNSAEAQAIRASGASWIDLSQLDDSAAAARIHALNLDVLVDLNGYTTGARPRLLAHRPAPVQVSWLVMSNTTGAPYIDYVLTDPASSPGGDWCSEAEVQLPQTYFVFSHETTVPITPRRRELGLPDDKFVFCCLNAAYKIEPDTFSAWMQILESCPQSVLWLLGANSAVVLNLKREAEWRGIDPRRLLFAPRVPVAEHLARLGAADLFLDTRQYNGHTTVAEALWSGLPVLSCPGETMASRVGGSLVRSCGLDELVVDSWEAYFQKAQQLYRERGELESLRRRLSVNRLHAAPFDLAGQARNLEKAFGQMRERFSKGLRPEGFSAGNI